VSAVGRVGAVRGVRGVGAGQDTKGQGGRGQGGKGVYGAGPRGVDRVAPGARIPVARAPEGLSARVPAEERGGSRDAVRLLVGRRGSGGVSHHPFAALPGLLEPGDVLVVNTSRTLPAAVGGVTAEGEPVVAHFSTAADDGRWAVELRRPDGRGSTLPRPGGPAGTVVRLAGGTRLVVEEPLSPAGQGDATGGVPARLWLARPDAPLDEPRALAAWLGRAGRPIRYGYTDRDQPLSAYQTVFAAPAPDGLGSAEMPSAARPFTPALVAAVRARGVRFAPITLHTGVASAEAHEPPYAERFAVPEESAGVVNAARAAGGRVIAVGTTAVRALESAVDARGVVRPVPGGWTELVVTPERGVRAVDGLLTGLHEPEASHLLMLAAVAGLPLLERVYAAAVRERYLWHEFGDVNLLLP
jgi:S-adenosylmethionine:tRNA ribosyltransferase-isomerase